MRVRFKAGVRMRLGFKGESEGESEGEIEVEGDVQG